jgi:hypothetical protein
MPLVPENLPVQSEEMSSFRHRRSYWTTCREESKKYHKNRLDCRPDSLRTRLCRGRRDRTLSRLLVRPTARTGIPDRRAIPEHPLSLAFHGLCQRLATSRRHTVADQPLCDPCAHGWCSCSSKHPRIRHHGDAERDRHHPWSDPSDLGQVRARVYFRRELVLRG